MDDNTRMRNFIVNNTILDQICIEDLSINKRYGLPDEDYLNIKLSIKRTFITEGNTCINPGAHYGIENSKIILYKDIQFPRYKNAQNDYQFYKIPIYITILLLFSNTKSIENGIKMDSSEILLKKIILPLEFHNNKNFEKGELICELYKFDNLLYLYFIKIILPNNEVFNFHKDCKLCKEYLDKRTTKFNIYNSTCIHVLFDYITFLKQNLGINNSIEINITNLINEINEYNNYERFFIQEYIKEVCYFDPKFNYD
jgi:hypothetical protein